MIHRPGKLNVLPMRGSMPAKERSYFGLLVESALACSHYRIVLNIYPDNCPEHWRALRAAVDALEALARVCRANGRDARQSPLYASFGGLASRYDTRYEFRRRVECAYLTPGAIYSAISKGNTLAWGEWTISCSRPQELTDAYGLPAWGPIVSLKCQDGEEFHYEYPDQETYQARQIFRQIIGAAYSGDDGLPDDPLHIYEHCYGCDDSD